MIQNLCPCKWLLRRKGPISHPPQASIDSDTGKSKSVASSQGVIAVVEAIAATMKRLSTHRNRRKAEGSGKTDLL